MKKINILLIYLLLTLIVNAQQAQSVILIYLDGGPTQTDTFDPKIGASRDIAGSFRDPIETNVAGVSINQKLPLLAKIADKYSIIRSMTHGANGHETAHYSMITGDLSGGSIVYPSFGTVIAYKMRDKYKGVLPPYISLTSANTRFNEGGFLGNDYKSFDTGGAPEKTDFEVEGIINRWVKPEKLSNRLDLLNEIENSNSLFNNTTYSQNIDSLRKRNNELIFGKAREVFNLKTEDISTRMKYGMNRFGQSCLTARRLVEAGVPFVNVRITGWDTHKSHFQKMATMLPELDQALSALISDLDEKGLLDKTIVLCGGEFGRTPKILWEAPWNGGRAHFSQAFSYLVAGGGFIQGKVLGATDSSGEKITERKVYPCDLIGTVYLLMGIDPKSTLPHISEGELPLLPSLGKPNQSNGLLYELIKPLK